MSNLGFGQASRNDPRRLCRYYVATYGDLGLEVQFFDDPLEYGRAVQDARRQHRIGEYDTYTHGPVDQAPVQDPHRSGRPAVSLHPAI